MKYYFDSYSFGNSKDVNTVLKYNSHKFVKSLFCGLCCADNPQKKILSSSMYEFDKTLHTDTTSTFNILEFDGRLFYIYPEHISNENFVFNKQVFTKIITYLSKKSALSLSWRRQSECENFGDHLYLEATFIEEGEAVVQALKIDMRPEAIDNTFNIVKSIFSDLRTSKDKYMLITDGYIKIVQSIECLSTTHSSQTYEFEQKTMDGECHNDEIREILESYKKCMYDCPFNEKHFLNYVISRYITCEASHFVFLEPGTRDAKNKVNEFYSKLLKDDMFYNLAVTSQILNTYNPSLTSSESRVLDGELVTELISRNIDNMVSPSRTLNTRSHRISKNLNTMYPIAEGDETVRKIFRIPYDNAVALGPKILSNSSTFGTVIYSDFGNKQVVVKIDKSITKEGQREDPRVFVREFLAGIKMNTLVSHNIVPLTLGCFICPSTLNVKGAPRHKRNAELCAYTEGSIPTSFLVIEKIDGVDLSSYLSKTLVSEKQLVSILLRVTHALIIAKEKLNFTHNDLHFGNIMVVKHPKLMEITDKIRVSGDAIKINKYDSNVHIKLIDFGMTAFDKKFQGIDVFSIILSLFAMFIRDKKDHTQFPRLVEMINDYIYSTQLFDGGVVKNKDTLLKLSAQKEDYETIGEILRRDKEHLTTFPGEKFDTRRLLFQNLYDFYFRLADIYSNALTTYTEPVRVQKIAPPAQGWWDNFWI
jgi:serine/threonine protein kinase